MNKYILSVFTSLGLAFVGYQTVCAQWLNPKTTDVDSLINTLTPKEKFQQMYGVHDGTTYTINSALRAALTGKGAMITSGRNKEKGIPGFTFVDGPKGVSYHGKHIVFPAPVLRGCSFDRELEYRVGQALATETAACGANYIGALTLNLTTHPHCGQAELWYGEDPYHAALMGVSLTKGIQKDHKVMACAKHFAMFELETNKGEINAIVNERALNEIYLIPFMKAVQDADVASMMTSYNKVNGEFASGNKILLDDIARKRWGFQGFYTSDWGFSVYDGLKAIKAGTNVEMPADVHFRTDSIYAMMDKGTVNWDDIHRLIKPTIATKLKYGENKAYRLSRKTKKELTALSQEAAEKSIVLLKNENILPLNPQELKRVLVVGDLAKNGNLGEYHYVPDHNYTDEVTPLRGIRRYLKRYGVSVTYCSGEDLNELSMLAQNADAIVVCVGRTDYTQSQNSINPDTMYPLADYNGGDRNNLDLSLYEQSILRTTYRTHKKTAVVYFGGSAVITTPWERLAPSILFAGFGGINGGNALAKVLFGEVNPSGKLSFSIFRSESDYPEIPDNPFVKATTKNDTYDPYVDPYDVNYDYYFGYMLADKKNIQVSYPFGFGLSYTDFSIRDILLDKQTYHEGETIKVSCLLKNTGKRQGGEVVQAYIGVNHSEVDRPQKALKNFAKAYLDAEEEKRMEIEIPVKDLAYWDEVTHSWKIEKTRYTLYIGTSSQDSDLQKIEFDVI